MPRPTQVAASAGVLLVALGLCVLADWFSHTLILVQVLPQLLPVRPNAAACLVLSGLAVLALARNGPGWVVETSTALAGALSFLTLVEHVFRVDVGIDELLGRSAVTLTADGSSPARMTASAAVIFAASSMALLLSRDARSKRTPLVVALTGSTIAAVGIATLMAYALGSSNAYGWGHVAHSPLLTAVGFLVLGLGMLALAWSDRDQAGTPRWLPVSVTIAMITCAIGLWQALIAAGQAAFAPLPVTVLGGGSLLAPIFGLTIFLAQRAHTQAAALRRSETFLAKVQQVSSTGGFYWWPATGEALWSDQVYRIFEVDPAVPLTQELRCSRIHPDDLPAYREIMRRLMRDPCDFEHEIRLMMPDGSVKYVHSLLQPTRDPEGNLLYIGAIQDVTARRASDLALSKVRSELAFMARLTTFGALTASIAHEINQPLSGIITNASTCLRMLGANPPNVPGAEETVRRTIRDGHRVSDIITKLRALYSRREATPEPVDLNDAVREVIALLLPDLHRNRVVLRTEFASALPAVMGDRVQLQQVMLNLLRNAADAMRAVDGRQRTLLVRTERDDGAAVRLSVQDAGIGFGPEAADKLFGAFYTTKPDGMGMGLSVSRSIIESHHGRLWATRNDGPGATFSFSLPCSPTTGLQAQEQTGTNYPGVIAVVDNDESVRESLPDLLQELGHAARAFASAEEYLASDCVGETSCLILDVAMPAMSGPDLRRELLRRRQRMPIVFITAHKDESTRSRLLADGAVACLFKPFKESALREALDAALAAN